MFSCVECGNVIGDDLYTRIGHAPRHVCFDCWVAFWELNHFDTTGANKKELSLWLKAEGWTDNEIATMLKVDARTIRRWRKQVRDNPGDFIEEIRGRVHEQDRASVYRNKR